MVAKSEEGQIFHYAVFKEPLSVEHIVIAADFMPLVRLRRAYPRQALHVLANLLAQFLERLESGCGQSWRIVTCGTKRPRVSNSLARKLPSTTFIPNVLATSDRNACCGGMCFHDRSGIIATFAKI